MKVIYKISAQYVKAHRRKAWKTVYFQYSKFQKGQKLMTLKHDLMFIQWKSYTEFQLNMPKHVVEQYRNLYFQYYKFQNGP